VFVLDVDGEEGAASVRDFCSVFGDGWMDTLAATTSRGRHLYFQFPHGAQIRNSASKLAKGLDVRGAGGYVIVPPSIHPSGHRYTWVEEDAPVALAPAWLLEILSTPVGHSIVGSDELSSIPEGQRNVALASLAGTMQRRGMTIGAIEAALITENAARSKPPLSKTEVLRIVASVARYAHGGNERASQPDGVLAGSDWQDPEALGGELPPVHECDIAMVPEALRALVEDTAERMQVPLDFPAAFSVLTLAGATNRRATIQPKAADTSWVVVPNLWGGVVAPPGLLKSPVIGTMTRPLAQIEALWRAEYESSLSEYQLQKEEAELRQAAWREQFKAAQKTGKDAP
jgi:hypothetical protein